MHFPYALWIHVIDLTFLFWRVSPADDYTARKHMSKKMLHSSKPP